MKGNFPDIAAHIYGAITVSRDGTFSFPIQLLIVKTISIS